MRGRIDARKKELAQLIADKAGFNLSDLLDSYVGAIIQQNADLLTPAEKAQFDEFFPAVK